MREPNGNNGSPQQPYLYKISYFFVLVHASCSFTRSILFCRINKFFQFHNLHSCQMLGSLRLGHVSLPATKKQGSVHYSRSVEHCCHQNIVPGAVNERAL